MEFKFNEDHEMFRKLVREFAEKEVAPRAAEYDEKHEFPWETVRMMGELGYMGIPIPEEYGGSGSDFISYIIAIEELSRVCGSHGVILSVHTSVGTFPILNFGTEEQKRKYVPRLAAGEIIGAFCLTEPNAGSDASGLRTTAVLDGDHWVLNGTKIFITNGESASVFCIMAVTDKEKGPHGITSFLVDKDTLGFRVGKAEKKMGLNASSTTEIILENARIPKDNVLGGVGNGFKVAMSLLDGGRVGIAAQGLGIAQGAYEFALKYAKEREQFGKPIASFQGISFKLADMATQIEAARLLVYQAAWMKQNGLPNGKQASMAKMFATDTAMKVTTQAIQILGGYGYTKEYPVERFFRDAKVTQIYEGTNQIQRLVISKHVLA